MHCYRALGTADEYVEYGRGVWVWWVGEMTWVEGSREEEEKGDHIAFAYIGAVLVVVLALLAAFYPILPVQN